MKLVTPAANRLFAAAYDRFAERLEEGENAERRAALVTRARGRVLEIGAGTGLNLRHYGPEVEELVLTEPEPAMLGRLAPKLADAPVPAPRMAPAPAERLPFPDGSFDTVVTTLVLCTVPDVPAALREIDRVLSPGGRLLFLEHVRSEDPRLAWWQDRVQPVWGHVARGCHCNRDTGGLLASSPLSVQEIERYAPEKDPAFLREAITGVAAAVH